MTALLPAAMPRRCASGSQSGSDSSSAKQKVYLPGLPRVARSMPPGRPPPTLRTMSCRARPIVALARLPWPSALTPRVHADRLGGRAVDDDQRAGEMRGAEQAVQHEQRIERGLQHAQHHGHVFRLAARHHGVDRHLLDGAGREVGRNQAHDLVGLAVGAAQHAQDALVGRRHDGQAVAPAALEAGFHRIVPVRRPRSRATSGRDRRSARSALPARRARRCCEPQPGCQAGRPLPSAAAPATRIHSARSQPTVRSTSRPPSKRIRVGTASILRWNERSSSLVVEHAAARRREGPDRPG